MIPWPQPRWPRTFPKCSSYSPAPRPSPALRLLRGPSPHGSGVCGPLPGARFHFIFLYCTLFVGKPHVGESTLSSLQTSTRASLFLSVPQSAATEKVPNQCPPFAGDVPAENGFWSWSSQPASGLPALPTSPPISPLSFCLVLSGGDGDKGLIPHCHVCPLGFLPLPNPPLFPEQPSSFWKAGRVREVCP